MRLNSGFLALVLFALAGCTVNVPSVPSGGLGSLDDLLNNITNRVDDALKDPFTAKPFPVVLGGDSEQVFYATNLTDIRLKFRGGEADVVLPGILGPSNVYKLRDSTRDLVLPLAPTGTTPWFANLVTDGRYVAYMAIADAEGSPRTDVVAARLDGSDARTVFSPGSEDESVTGLAIADGRLAFVIFNSAGGADRLRIEDLSGVTPAVEHEAAEIREVALHGGYVATVEYDASHARVVLRSLASDAEAIKTAELPSSTLVDLALADNTLVWSEAADEGSAGVSRVMAYDIPSGATRVWIDAAAGQLAGATDEFVLTQESIAADGNSVERVAVWRFAADGSGKKLAEFRADGFAGQTHALGDRAVWVNADREIVIQPLAGGDRKLFKPF